MNLQDIKLQLDALNKVVSEMESVESKFTFTQEQMEKFVEHIVTVLMQEIIDTVENDFELDEESINVDINNDHYGRGGKGFNFTVELDIDQREIKRNIRDIVESSCNSEGIMNEVVNFYSAIVSEPIVEAVV
jgi:hypothetical protein